MKKLTERLRAFADARDWAQFHSPKNLSMALAVEAAELMEHFQWLSEAESHELSDEKLAEVTQEMADVFIFLVRMADIMGVDLEQAAWDKLAINENKYPADQVRGSAKKSTEY